MKRLMVGDCAVENIFALADPDVPLEAEFELTVMKVLGCLYKDYRCFRFTGGFEYDGKCFEPDLALVAKNYSHWFVIEVELVSHSLEQHVLPQVRTFHYGDPLPQCSTIMARELGLDRSNAESLMEFSPRSVVVIANRYHEQWESKLQAHSIQYLTVSSYHTASGVQAIELSGHLNVLKENLGFGTYSRVDRSFRFPASVMLPDGEVQITDPTGSLGVWNVVREGRIAWVTKVLGTPDIADLSFLQLIRSFDGRLLLKAPNTGRIRRG
jgi:hypothetical protein